MDVRDFDRISFVTRHFRELQGLRQQVPLGLVLLSQGLMPTMHLVPSAGKLLYLPLYFLFVMGLNVGAMVLMSRVPRHYRNLFGEVEVRGGAAPSSYWPVFVLASLVLLYRFAVGSLSLWRILGMLCGSVLLAGWCRREHRWSQSYHLLLGGLLLALALLLHVSAFGALQRVFGSVAEISPTLANLLNPAEQAVFGSLAGLSLILAGLLDHRQLVRTLGHLPPPELGEAGAAMAATEEAR
jgi:hypothetical protein